MIIGSQQWHQLWEVIKAESLESTEKGIAVVFSLQEVETVCAVKMLLAGLKVQDVHFATYPVDNYTELRGTLHTLLDGSLDYRTVVLINCGAGQYVGDMQPASCRNVRFVVVDSHRPVSPKYNNEDDLDCVLVMDADDPLHKNKIPEADVLDNMTEQERQQIEEFARQEEQESEDCDSEEAQEVSREFRDQRARIRKRDRLLANYFAMGSSYGKPSPLVLQPLIEELVGKPDLRVLWPCCVGLTDQWIHQRISTQHYESWYAVLSDQVKSQYQAPLQEQQQQQQQEQQQNRNNRIPSKTCIVAAQDFRLMLYRHWSLYNAFAYSSYVAPRMQTWRQAGQDNLNLLLAHMGIKVENAKRHYSSLKDHEHKALRDRLKQGIEDSKSRITYAGLGFDGFALLHNLKTTAASDVVHAATALLTEHTLTDAVGTAPSAAAFWAAAEAVDAYTTGGWQQLNRGIEMAKYMQEAIIKDGGLMVSDRMLKVKAVMQELNLQQMPPTNAKEFRHPLTLLRLAQFVRDANKVARGRALSFPVLVVGPEDAQGWCLVIGLRGEQHKTGAQYNVFGRTLKAVLESPDSQAQWDHTRESFDDAVVYVHKNSIANFLLDIKETLLADAKAAEEAKQQEQQQQQQQGQRRSREEAGGGEEDSRGSQRPRLSQQDGLAAAAGDGRGAAGTDDEELVDSEMEAEEDVVAASEDGGEHEDK